MSKEIIIGIIAGILTSIITWIVIKMVNKVILPWFESATFKGIMVSGTWRHIDNQVGDVEGSVYEDTLVIRQRGYSISGEYTCRNQREGEILVTEYSMSGHIQDNYLLINYKRKGNTGTGIGSFLLKIIRNSDMLEGGVSFIELKSTKVINYGGVIFKRQ